MESSVHFGPLRLIIKLKPKKTLHTNWLDFQVVTTTKTIREVQYLGPDGQPLDYVPNAAAIAGPPGTGSNYDQVWLPNETLLVFYSKDRCFDGVLRPAQCAPSMPQLTVS